MNDSLLPTHFESLYPEESRFEEIEKILAFIKEGKSTEIISAPGAGRSNLLGLLAYNHAVKNKHLGENQKWFHFVYWNFSEVKKRSFLDVTKFIFLSLIDSLRDRKMLDEHDRLRQIFKDHLEYKDELVLFQGLKEAIDFLSIEKELTIIFLFDQFEQYIPDVSPSFFENLRILRNRAKYRFSTVFSLTRPLEELIEGSVLSSFYEFIGDHHVYLTLIDKPGFEFRLAYLEKITGKKIAKELIDKIVFLTGGHGKLTKLSEEIVLSENLPKQIEEKKLIDFLLSKRTISQVLLEIWNSLIPNEQQALANRESNKYLENVSLLKNGKIAIPLLETFIKNEGKKIRNDEFYFDDKTKEIRKGDQVISDKLTSLEYKLLSFLLANKDSIVNREEIIKAVWSETSSTAGVTDQAVDQLVSRLRKKIEEDSNKPIFIQTIKGRGIKFSD